jgi:hypothetical protein
VESRLSEKEMGRNALQVVIAMGLCVAVVMVAVARPTLQAAPAVLMSAFPQPAYYPSPFVTAQGTMLAADPDAEDDEEKEDEAEGRELSDLETGTMYY